MSFSFRSKLRPLVAVVVLGMLFSVVCAPFAQACTPPEAPFNIELSATFAEGTGSLDIAIGPGYLYAADAAGLSIYDVADPGMPALTGSIGLPSPGIAVGFEQATGLVYVLGESHVVYCVDVSDPSAPVVAGSFDPAEPTHGLAVAGSRVFLAANSGLRIVDFATPASPVELNGFDTSAPAYAVEVVGDTAYVATHYTDLAPTTYVPTCYDTTVFALDVSGVTPTQSDSHVVPYGVPSLASSGDGSLLFVACDTGDGSYLKVFDISDPSYLCFVTALDAGEGGGLDVASLGTSAFVSGSLATRMFDASQVDLTYMSGYNPVGTVKLAAIDGWLFATTAEGALLSFQLTDTSSRSFGANRYDTAVDVCRSFASAPYVVVTTGMNYPDALAGATLAYALDAPILLAGGNGLSAAALAEVERLGADHAILLGGKNVVPDAVKSQLAGVGVPLANIERIGGVDRYDTARLVAVRVRAVLGGGPVSTAFIATGANFPDALAAAGVAAKLGAPVLLVKPTSVPAATASALTALGVTDTIVLGSSAAVSDPVMASLPSPQRIGGDDRYETARMVADWSIDGSGAGFVPQEVVVATGQTFPDALASGVYAAMSDAPTVLVNGDVPDPTNGFVTTRKAQIERFTVIGSTAAVSTDVERVLVGLLR
ncbi:MAG: hypothetical protein CVT59_10905 [Actinobacteria bacterium HGW-Actinobacteria-1]|jgi:putative cell wall-binding protein|nr:MAG: hypothetical protein CVT59_10905 [Actinobacteria bacterium HGW-Actinobacteria-1]